MLFRGGDLQGEPKPAGRSGPGLQSFCSNRLGPCEAESFQRRAQPVFLSRCLREHAAHRGSIFACRLLNETGRSSTRFAWEVVQQDVDK